MVREETGKAYKVYGRGERKRGRPTRFMSVVREETGKAYKEVYGRGERGNGEGLQGLWAW